MQRVLFVCLGNICRSPAGDNVFRNLIEQEGLQDQIECDSAGTIGYHTGNSPDSRMSATLKSRGYKIHGRARQIQVEDFNDFDLIVTMDDSNYKDVCKVAPNKEAEAKVKKFVSFCSEHDDTEVPDPYYGGQDGFEHVADLMEDGCRNLLNQLR